MASPPPPPPTASPPSSSPPPPSTAPPAAAPRKFPAPCWTHEETLALISAYRDKWYSLRRRNLRTADWEAVAADVTRRCPNQSPPKTSAQCRHKMEKLRKRYRTEKQRFLSLPHNHLHGRIFSPSSWAFFDLMDSMEAGTDPLTHSAANNPPVAHINPNPTGVFVKAVVANPSSAVTAVDSRPDLKGKDELGKYFDEILMGGPIKIRVKNHRRFEDAAAAAAAHHHHHHDDGGDDYIGRNLNPNPNQGHPPPPPAGYKRMFPAQDYEERFETTSSSGKRGLNGESKRRSDRDRDSVAEMVSSIKMLGEGLVRMEKMKMDMMREIERMRMEMEMKRSEMILESQQLIVNAFVEGLKKNKKAKIMEVE